MHYLVISPLGLFVFDEGSKLVKHADLGKNPKEIARVLVSKESPEIDKLKKEFNDLVIEQPNNATDYYRENFRNLAQKSGLDKNLNIFLNEFGIALSVKEISGIGRRDKLIIHTVSALGDLDRILNIMSERLREWYGLHYPETDIGDHEKFVNKIADIGMRENFEDFSESMGMELEKDDMDMLQSYAKNLGGLYKLKKELVNYLEKIVPTEIPNINALLGSVLAARILTLAGSLERMAKLPSSTIQLLGAEKTLFKYLKGRDVKRPPKFGLLFLHPDISGSEKKYQGKVARLLSSKLTLAARADFYTKNDMGEKLVKDYKDKLRKILGD